MLNGKKEREGRRVQRKKRREGGRIKLIKQGSHLTNVDVMP